MINNSRMPVKGKHFKHVFEYFDVYEEYLERLQLTTV